MSKGIFLAALLWVGAQGVQAQPPVIVGAVVTQSGNLADLAADLRKGLLLWQEEANARGGLAGRRVELKLLDDRSEAVATGPLYEQLVREDKADLLIGPFGSAATLAAASVAERHRRVLVNATGAARAAHKASFRYVFQVAAPFGEYGAGALAVVREAGLRRLAIFARNEPAARESAARLREDALKAGLEAGEVEVHAPGNDDFAPQIARAQKRGAEAWVAFGQARDAAEMVKSFRKLAYAPALFVAQGAADPAFVKLVGQDAESAMGVLAYAPALRTRDNARFAEAYAKKWSAEPSLLAAQGYGAARVLEEAVRLAASLDPARLREALGALETETPLGPYRVDASGAQLAAKPVLVQIQRGRREIVWPEALATAKRQLPYARWEDRKLLK